MPQTQDFSGGPMTFKADRVEWLLLAVPGLTWGSSVALIALRMRAVGPFGVTLVRVSIGLVTLSLFPSARKPISRSRVSDQSSVQQSVHATVRAGVEETRARGALESVHRELCRWHAGTDVQLKGWKSPDPNRPFGDLAGGRVGGASRRLK